MGSLVRKKKRSFLLTLGVTAAMVALLMPPAYAGAGVQQKKIQLLELLGLDGADPAVVRAAHQAHTLYSVEALPDDGNISVVLRLSDLPEYDSYLYKKDRRLVVDLRNTVNLSPASKLSLSAEDPVKQVRSSQFRVKPSLISRVVLDLDEHATPQITAEGNDLVINTMVERPQTATTPAQAEKESYPMQVVRVPAIEMEFEPAHTGLVMTSDTEVAAVEKPVETASFPQETEPARPEASAEAEETPAQSEAAAQVEESLSKDLATTEEAGPTAKPAPEDEVEVPALEIGEESAGPVTEEEPVAPAEEVEAAPEVQIAEAEEPTETTPAADAEESDDTAAAEQVEEPAETVVVAEESVEVPMMEEEEAAIQETEAEVVPTLMAKAVTGQDTAGETSETEQEQPVDSPTEEPAAEEMVPVEPKIEQPAETPAAMEPEHDEQPEETPSVEIVAAQEPAPAPQPMEVAPEQEEVVVPESEQPEQTLEAEEIEEPETAQKSIPESPEEPEPVPTTVPQEPEERPVRRTVAQYVAPEVEEPVEEAAPVPSPVEMEAEVELPLQKTRVTLTFREADLSAVLDILARKGNLNILAGRDVKGVVTVRLVDVPLDVALDAILNVNGYGYVKTDNIVRILPLSKLGKEIETVTETYMLSYADAEDAKTTLQGFLTHNGSIEVDKRTNMIIVTDIPSNIANIHSLVPKIDTRVQQVMIEVLILDSVLSDDADLGIQWNLFHTDDNSLDLSGNQDSIAVNLPFTATGGLNVSFGTLLGDVKLASLIKVLVENSNSRILANPKILTVNNESASIEIIQEFPYSDVTQTSAGGQLSNITFKEIGTKLEVTPQITHDQHVILKVTPEQNFPADITTTGIPIIDTRRAETTLIVKDHQTIVLGGLRLNRDLKSVSKIPLLGDLPGVKYAFRSVSSGKSDTELLVFITVHIVESPPLLAEEKLKYGEMAHLPRKPGSTIDLVR